MKVLWLLLSFPLFGAQAISQSYKCLPAEVKPDEIVSTISGSSSSGQETISKITVAQTLKKRKAKCARGKLVDRNGRQIRFYRLKGCWGNPPADYLEILERQRKEIADLQKRFTVIEMTCNPTGVSSLSIS